MRKVSGGSTTTYLYDGSTLVAEYTGSASTYHASGVSFTNGVSGDRFFYRENALGSNLATVGMTGNAVSRTEYDAYGMELSIQAGTNTSHRFAGRHGYYKDDSTGLSLLGQRFYHAKIGKFLTQDPIGHSGGLNLYAYCDNGPLVSVDPDGTRPITSADQARFSKLENGMKASFGKDYSDRYFQEVKRGLEVEIRSVTAKEDPVRLRALWWAIDNLGNTDYKPDSGGPKCNLFVYNTYQKGAKVSMPTRYVYGVFNRGMFGANEFGGSTRSFDELGRISPARPGDIVAFENKDLALRGHMTLKVGPGLLIYAGDSGVKVGTFAANMVGKSRFSSWEHKK